MSPIVDDLASDYGGKAVIYKVDIDEFPGTAEDYDVTGIPTFLVFKDGQVVSRIVGATDKSELAAALDAAIE
jgi:thioredoxin 1